MGKKKYATKERLMGLFGLRPYDKGFNDFEPVFIGLDIEAVREQRQKASNSPEYEPQIAEVGLAIIDSRDLADHTSSSPRELIKCSRVCGNTRSESFSTDAAGEPRIADQVREKIQIPDGMCCDGRFRNIVIVGHSPQGDLTMLKNLGLDLDGCAVEYEILDTHKMANEILPSGSKWTLKEVMKRLGCTYNPKLLHKGEHDARYHLQVMAKLACQVFDDEEDQTTPLPISGGPDGCDPPPRTGMQARRDLLQEWCRVEFSDEGRYLNALPESGASSSSRRRIISRSSGEHERHH
ncbi:hypothetical protein PG984_003999 [Apiospora sp. TS-2023a]